MAQGMITRRDGGCYVWDKYAYSIEKQAIPASTKALLHFDGNVADQTGLNTPAVYGTAAYAAGKFGNAFKFNGSNAPRIPMNTNITFGTGDFTIAGWFYVAGNSASGFLNLFCQNWYYSSSYKWTGLYLRLLDTGQLNLIYGTGYNSSIDKNSTATTDISTARWMHIALVRNGGTLTAYVDGNAMVSDNIGSANFYQHPNAPLQIGGSNQEGSASANLFRPLSSGSMVDEVIIAKEALWTSNFVPPSREFGYEHITIEEKLGQVRSFDADAFPDGDVKDGYYYERVA